MKFSLSVRIAEAPKRKDIADIPIEPLAPLAANAGFQALSMRASVASVNDPPERPAAVRKLLDGLGLGVSMATGDVPLAVNDAAATDALRNIEPYLALSEALGCRLVRVMMHGAEDIPLARKAAEAAARRGLTLAHMTHWGTLIETSADALAIKAAVDHPNFGVVMEPANMVAAGEMFDAAIVESLAPHLVNVMFQNICLDPDAPIAFHPSQKGRVAVRYVPLDDASGLAGHRLIQILRQAGYDGWFTIHQPLRGEQTAADAVQEAGRFIQRYL